MGRRKNIKTRKRIALGVLGELGNDILKFLSKCDVEIIGVDTLKDRKGQVSCEETIRKLKLPRKNYQEMVELNPDIFISISYLKMVGSELLDKCLCVNLHVAKLPEYRGRNPYTMAIQNGEKEYYTTLIKMDEGLDTGDIISERKSPIYFGDTAKSLFERMQYLSFKMFVEEFSSLIDGSFKTKKQRGKGREYKKNLDKNIKTSNPLKIYNKIRSLDFPPYEPALWDEKKINYKQYVYWLLSQC
jgi:methionyl-tRNA formyltransferase